MDVIVVWKELEGLWAEDRSQVILDAYQDQRDRISMAMGVTYQEAIDQQLLPYTVVPMTRHGEVDPAALRRAMLEEGGIALDGGKVDLRFPTPRWRKPPTSTWWTFYLAGIGRSSRESVRSRTIPGGRLLERKLILMPDSMNRIDTLFDRLRNEKRRALMPFVTAGDPDLSTTGMLISELIGRGAHLVEVGIPYSDPIADGPVISASYHRALERGVKVAHIFQTLRTLRAEGSARFNDAPMVSMVSYAIIHRLGMERYLNDAATAGFDGLIVPDLPCRGIPDLAGEGHPAQPQADPAHHPDDPP